MSSMIQGPPPRIPLPGPAGVGAPPAPPAAAQAPDSAAVKQHVMNAIRELRAAEDAEGHDPDAAILANAVAILRKFVGAQTDLGDQAMGAGPGIKLVRKNTAGGGAPAGPSGGGY